MDDNGSKQRRRQVPQQMDQVRVVGTSLPYHRGTTSPVW
jgi:hypothetical protein